MFTKEDKKPIVYIDKTQSNFNDNRFLNLVKLLLGDT